MPRQKNSGQLPVETATPVATPTKQSLPPPSDSKKPKKRGIRWFVNPPAYQRMTPSKTDPFNAEDNVQSSSRTTSHKSSRWGRAIFGNTSTRTQEFIDPNHPSVLQLQRELEDAREQIEALSRIKALQAEETGDLKRQLRAAVADHGPEKVLFPPDAGFESKQRVVPGVKTKSTESEKKSEMVAKSPPNPVPSKPVVPPTNESSAPPQLPSPTNQEGAEEGTADQIFEETLGTFDPQASILSRDQGTTSLTEPLLNGMGFENMGDLHQMEPERETIENPPSEVVMIREPILAPLDTSDAATLRLRLRDTEQRAAAYHARLESSQDLVASLFRDMERARRTIHALANRNSSLSGHIKDLKLDQEENMIHRSTLAKAAIYIFPVFILIGGLEFYLSTVLLIWIIVEIEVGWRVGDDDEDDELEDEQKEQEESLSTAAPQNPKEKGE